ncbi:MAG: hypothetical protein KA190_22915 [Kofleriaceae bacterium]|nr:hypothetical protein [Kofleriaceae bacterium]
MAKVRFSPAAATHRARVHAALAGALGAGARGDVATRYLAGLAAFRDRDGGRVAALMADPSRRVRAAAVVTTPLACDDPQVLAALRVAWGVRGERTLLRRLVRHGRRAPIDVFLDELAALGQLRDLVDDLPFGSDAAVRRHLHHALARPSQRWWRRLAHGHPAILLELLMTRWGEHPSEADPVTRQLTEAHHARLAERVPDGALALAELLLTRGIEPAAPVWTELLRLRPAAAVELAVRCAARVPAGVLACRLRELAPAVLARVVAEAPHLLGEFGPRVRTLSPDRRAALAEGWLGADARFAALGTHLLRYLPDGPARDAAYQRWSLAARDRDGVIAADALAALPTELATREARRHVDEVIALGADPIRRLRGIARYLPWAELEGALRDHLGHPDPTLRGVALSELLANADVFVDDASLPARALAVVSARAFEQDPIRLIMFHVLGRWPRRCWRAEHLPAVAAAVRAGLDAADLSIATVREIQHLLTRLFALDPRWAAAQLATTIKERGALHDANLGAKLTDAELRAAAPALVEIATDWATLERAPWLVGFASGLGRRLGVVDGLVALLIEVRDTTPHEWVAHQLAVVLARHAPAEHAATLPALLARLHARKWHAVLLALAEQHGLHGRAQARQRHRRRPTLVGPLCDAVVALARGLDPRFAGRALAVLRQRDPEAFDRLLPALIDADASVAIVPDVQRWIHRHRQDLLEPYLGDRPVRGAWATGKTRWVLPWRDGFFRWSPPQVERFAALTARIVDDRGRDVPTVLSTLTVWPAMEYASMDRLCALADDSRPAVREKAIRVLARCDAGQGVPTLLACLADARARFAVYGLRRALFAMVPERALALLVDAPMHKVTIAKEVVRLTGELRAAGAFARLTELAAAPLHRDVRIALLRALWDHLDHEATWATFAAAVTDPDWVVASRLAEIPANRLTVELDARLAALLARVIDRPEPESRLDLLGRARYLALVDRERVLLAACRARLWSPLDGEVAAAMDAVMARSKDDDLAALGVALDQLRADPRALHVAAAALCRHKVHSRRSWQRAADELVAVSRRDPRWAVIAVQATLARARAGDVVEVVNALADQGWLDHDALSAAIAGLATLRDQDLPATVAALCASAAPRARRVAVAALAHDARPGRGWSQVRLAQLAALRADPDPEVAGAAARLWPPREQDPPAAGAAVSPA